MLGWFVDWVVTAVLKDPKQLIQETSVNIQPENLPDAVLDENVDIHLICCYYIFRTDFLRIQTLEPVPAQ